jgi:hypothetical protein
MPVLLKRQKWRARRRAAAASEPDGTENFKLDKPINFKFPNTAAKKNLDH